MKYYAAVYLYVCYLVFAQNSGCSEDCIFSPLWQVWTATGFYSIFKNKTEENMLVLKGYHHFIMVKTIKVLISFLYGRTYLAQHGEKKKSVLVVGIKTKERGLEVTIVGRRSLMWILTLMLQLKKFILENEKVIQVRKSSSSSSQ